MYIFLIVLQIIQSLFFKYVISDKEKQERRIAQVGMFLIFLLLALKKETVGIDILGYSEQYENAKFAAWDDFGYVYFEWGYQLINKLFAKAGLSFQLFTVVLYALWCHSIYLLIRKYSLNAMLSLFVFMCYNFLVFSISGLRQTLAMALCVYALVACSDFSKRSFILMVLLMAAAIIVHQSAIVFIAVIFLMLFANREMKVKAWLIITVAVTALRSRIWNLVWYLFGKSETGFVVGGNFIFLCGILLFVSFTYFYYKSKRVVLPKNQSRKKEFYLDAFLVRSVFCTVVTYIIFSGGTLLRANMYFTLLFIPAIPNFTAKYTQRTRIILDFAMTVFLIALFYTETLQINQLNLCPYQFFWQ